MDTTENCVFCGWAANRDEPETYKEVTSWVHGKKLDGPVLREQTGRIAHEECIKMVVAGQAADQPKLDI